MTIKRIPIFILTVVLVTLLGACGSESNGAAEELENSDSVEVSETRVYESVKGDIELPTNPERVVVAVQDYVGDVLALGVTPVGAAGWVFDTPYYEQQLKDVESVGETMVSVEKITGLKPDIIFTYSEEQYEDLSKIAPTVFIPYGEFDYRERLKEFGKILGKEKEAEEWLANLDQKLEKKKEELFQHVDKDDKVAIVELAQKEIYLMGISYGRGGEILYNELDFSAPSKVEEAVSEDGWASISLETLPDFLGEADHIFLGVRDSEVGVEGGEDRKDDITSLSLWEELPAVEAGNIYEYEVQTMYFQDPIALDNQLDFIVEEMLSSE
ncbi:iron-hydroxamate ABC transporter substrate-binding protein [Salipaludibacillus sp. HK11]|uniref:iron-hydroxamate ABC transporter substrate-binding protein n=1 Tax=Salipaludibacillus sp. HK11 TaxID=3394320 RepID=UPI0039FC76D5